MSGFAVKTSQHLGSPTAPTAVIGGIAWETWSHDEWEEVRIGLGFRVTVRVTRADCSFRAPEVVMVLVEECGDEAVVDRHVDQGQRPGVFRQRTLLLLRHLPCRLIEDLGWRGRRIEEHNISPILRPLCAVGASNHHHLVVGLCVCVAPERRWRTEQKVAGALDAEWSYVLPVKESSDRNSIDDWATRRGLIRSWNRGPRYLELRRRRAIVGPKSNHGSSSGVAGRDAIRLGVTVGYQGQRTRAGGAQRQHTAREIGVENLVRGLDGCRIG